MQSTIRAALSHGLRRLPSDMVLALFVVAIAGMLLVPLPTPLLDLLLVINISFSLLLLLAGLYMPNALALLAFPSLLLLTTLFRLGLNVASTRLILSQGDAGQVISGFGTFLIRGEVAVGLIIFLIITIVNFIVIARGASRVSEVAARFALDALPGKQLAIDADLRSGLISAEEAGERREDLRKESQLYGAMDGAMKFVQGDAIAGLFIIAVNIIGGMYLGIRQGMSFQDAVTTYTVLTVGDGLVSQIPALLISICAGMVVTRISSGENTTLGADLQAQLLARPGTFVLAAIILLAIATIPGLPPVPFAVVGVSFLAIGYRIWRASRSGSELGTPVLRGFVSPGGMRALPHGSPPGLPAPRSDDVRLEGERECTVYVDQAALYRSYRLQMQHYSFWYRELQSEFYHATGLPLPEIQVLANSHLMPGEYEVRIGGVQVEKGRVPLDQMLVEIHPESAALFGLDVRGQIPHPVDSSLVIWTSNSPGVRRVIEAAEIGALDPFEYITLRVAQFYRRSPEELLTLTEVHGLVKQFEKRHPGLIAEAFNRSFMTLPRLTEVLQDLIRQGLSMRDLGAILHAVAAYCASFGGGLSEEDQFESEEVVSAVRRHRRRHLVTPLLSDRRSLRVVQLDHEVEELLEANRDSIVRALPHEFEADEALRQIKSGLLSVIDPVLARGTPTVSILCGEAVQALVRNLVHRAGMPLSVFTKEELPGSTDIELVGVWKASSRVA